MRNTCMTTIHKFKHFFMPNMLHFVNLYGTIEYRLPIPIWSELLQVLLRSCWFTIAKMSVTLDIGLPKMDGYEFARRLRTKPQFNSTIIIMLTSRDGVIDRLKGRLAGAKDYITKPFRTQDVINVLHTHLGVPTYS